MFWVPSLAQWVVGRSAFTAVLCLVTQWCPILCDRVDCSLPGSSVHGVLQARILEWVAMCFSRGIFPTQGLNPSLSHCMRILYHLREAREALGVQKIQTLWTDKGVLWKPCISYTLLVAFQLHFRALLAIMTLFGFSFYTIFSFCLLIIFSDLKVHIFEGHEHLGNTVKFREEIKIVHNSSVYKYTKILTTVIFLPFERAF